MKTSHITTVLRFAGIGLLAAVSVLPALADFPSTLLSYGPIGYWRFNDTNASPALLYITNAVYPTPAGIGTGAGYLVGGTASGPTLGVPGIIGNCAQFNSDPTDVGAAANRIDVPWNTAFNPTPPFTVEFWANP